LDFFVAVEVGSVGAMRGEKAMLQSTVVELTAVVWCGKMTESKVRRSRRH
jgi:hypothetical protein